MRRTSIFSALIAVVLVAAAGFASDIPARPEQLVFPDLSFDVPDADALRFELSTGTPVYAMEDHQLPLVTIAVMFRGGDYLQPKGKEGLTAIAEETWRTGGAGDRTAQELDEELDFLAANLSTSINQVNGRVTLDVMSKDLDSAMAILMDVLTKPRFQEDRFNKAKEDLIQDMKTRNDHAASIEEREWSRLMYGDDYWMNRLPTKASVDGITAEDCKAFIASLIRADNLVVAVAGDFDKVALKAMLEKTVGALPKLEASLPDVPQPSQTAPAGVYVVNKTDVNQGMMSIGHLGLRFGHPDEFPLRGLVEVMGGSGFTSRTMKRVRSDAGLTYGAYATLGFPVSFPGNLRAFFQSKSSTCPYGTEIIFNIIKEMRVANVSDEELATTKTKFIETFPRNFQSARQTVSIFAIDELLGRPHEYWYTFRDKVAALTADQLREAAQKHLKLDELVVLVVGNIEEIAEGHPEHEAKLTDFGEIRKVPLRDPLTLEPMVE